MGQCLVQFYGYKGSKLGMRNEECILIDTDSDNVFLMQALYFNAKLATSVHVAQGCFVGYVCIAALYHFRQCETVNYRLNRGNHFWSLLVIRILYHFSCN